jgi:hypothetical protein
MFTEDRPGNEELEIIAEQSYQQFQNYGQDYRPPWRMADSEGALFRNNVYQGVEMIQ